MRVPADAVSSRCRADHQEYTPLWQKHYCGSGREYSGCLVSVPLVNSKGNWCNLLLKWKNITIQSQKTRWQSTSIIPSLCECISWILQETTQQQSRCQTWCCDTYTEASEIQRQSPSGLQCLRSPSFLLSPGSDDRLTFAPVLYSLWAGSHISPNDSEPHWEWMAPLRSL